MKHVMIDLETLGTSPDSVWLSIAAIQFDPKTGEQGAKFLSNVSISSAQKLGRTIDPNTIKWWLEQRHEVMLKMFKDTKHIETVLREFSEFWKDIGATTPWGNSAAFDLGILQHSYKQIGESTPWFFTFERCYRTVNELAGKPGSKKDATIAHDPLYDCEYQIECLHKAYKKLQLC